MHDERERAREAALRHLERKRRTRRELEERLSRSGFSAEAIAGALDRLAGVGLVDDLEYASAYLRERLPRRAVGDRVLRRELLRRGVPAEVVRQALSAFRGDADRAGESSELERARRAIAQLRPRYARLDPVVAKRRLLAALARRGFSASQVEEALVEIDGAPLSPGDS
jgi:regulatory protein